MAGGGGPGVAGRAVPVRARAAGLHAGAGAAPAAPPPGRGRAEEGALAEPHGAAAGAAPPAQARHQGRVPRQGPRELEHRHAVAQRHAGLAGLGAPLRGCGVDLVLAAQLAARPVAAHAALGRRPHISHGAGPGVAPDASSELRPDLPPCQHARCPEPPQGSPAPAQRPGRAWTQPQRAPGPRVVSGRIPRIVLRRGHRGLGLCRRH